MKKSIIILLVALLPLVGFSQITYFASASNPADNGTLAGPTVSVTPPASMQAGDLVLLVVGYKAETITFSVSTTGGQAWTSAGNSNQGFNSGVILQVFWCRYNGTWSANPAVTVTTGTLAMSVQMHVFRPSSSSNSWNVTFNDNREASTASSPTWGSIYPSYTLTTGSLGFGAAITADDNTFTNTSGTYTTAGTAQYRNLQGTDISMGAQYRIENSATPTAVRPEWTHATLGPDTWGALHLNITEQATVAKPHKIIKMQF